MAQGWRIASVAPFRSQNKRGRHYRRLNCKPRRITRKLLVGDTCSAFRWEKSELSFSSYYWSAPSCYCSALRDSAWVVSPLDDRACNRELRPWFRARRRGNVLVWSNDVGDNSSTTTRRDRRRARPTFLDLPEHVTHGAFQVRAVGSSGMNLVVKPLTPPEVVKVSTLLFERRLR